MLKIKEIRAKCFRGIKKEKRLRLNGNNLLLFGDNGFGKSSFVEALEFALTGNIRRFSEHQALSLNRHATHTRCKSQDRLAEVTLLNNNGEYLIDTGKEINGNSEEVKDFLKAAADGTFILRRNYILSFIDAKDSERYQIIRPFLALDEFEQFEQLLKEVKEESERRFNNLRTENKLLEQQILSRFDLTEDNQVNQDILLEALNESLKLAQLPTVDLWDDIAKTWNKLSGALTETDESTSLLNPIEEASVKLNDYRVALPTNGEISDLLTKNQLCIEEESKVTGKFYEEVLTLGKKWIKEDELTKCPLCEQPIDALILFKRIDERLANSIAVTAARTEVDCITQTVRTKLKEATRIYELAFEKWKNATLPKDEWPYSNLQEHCKSIAGFLGEKGRCQNQEALKITCDAYNEFNQERANEQSNDLLKSRQPKEFQAVVRCKSCIDDYPKLEKYRLDLDRNKILSIRANQLYDTAVEARKRACTEIFESIEDSINRIYSSFHPDEAVGGCSLTMKEHGKGSTKLVSDYDNRKGDDPRGLYSESHLDTLGLAIFLALRERNFQLNPGLDVIVLDDVLTSVDAPHRERIAEYLLTKISKDCQLIITTHNRVWFDWLMNIQKRTNKHTEFLNLRITDWSKEDGPKISDMVSDYEKLCKDIKDGVPYMDLVHSAALILEEILQGLRYSLKLAVHAKPDERYDIGDIWPKFVSSCKKKFKALWSVIQSEVEKLDYLIIERNWLLHLNKPMKELSRNEVMQFVNPIVNLYPQLYCTSCNMFVEEASVPKGVIACRKGCLKYEPRVNENVEEEDS
jgi:energy-coupling factor transporter ATP-binding protein EcfA2